MAETVRTLIFDANVLVAAMVALAAGLVSFASPCVVPLVPGYLSYMTGLSGADLANPSVRARGRVLVGSLLFVIGFAIPFTMLGFAVGTLNFLDRSPVARIAMGGIVAILGLMMARGQLTRELRSPTGPDRGPRDGARARVRLRGRLDPLPRPGGGRDPDPVDGRDRGRLAGAGPSSGSSTPSVSACRSSCSGCCSGACRGRSTSSSATPGRCRWSAAGSSSRSASPSPPDSGTGSSSCSGP
jgi:hypothetical protein